MDISVNDKLASFDLEEQLATRAAWLYFVGGSTQAEIGKKLGLSRIRVNRLLAFARESAIVQFKITGKLATCISLEAELKNKFKLSHAIIVPSPLNEDHLPQIIGNAAGQYLGSRLKDNMSVGVGWGKTLRHSLNSVPRKSYKSLSVVSLMGGLTQASLVNPHETASHLADIVGAKCYYIAAPALTDSEETRDVFLKQSMVRDVFERGGKVSIALLSVGELQGSNTMSQLGLISKTESASLRKSGAVGDICGHWIDRNGEIVDHSNNRRVIALPPEKLKNIPCVVLASGGKNKVPVLCGALKVGFVDVLVTDENSARQILNDR